MKKIIALTTVLALSLSGTVFAADADTNKEPAEHEKAKHHMKHEKHEKKHAKHEKDEKNEEHHENEREMEMEKHG